MGKCHRYDQVDAVTQLEAAEFLPVVRTEAHHAGDIDKDVREVCPKPFAQQVQLRIVPQVAEDRAVAFLAQGLVYPGHAYTRFAQQS